MGQDPSGHPTRTSRISTASVFGPVVNSKDTCCQSFVPEGTGADAASAVSGEDASAAIATRVAALRNSSVRTIPRASNNSEPIRSAPPSPRLSVSKPVRIATRMGITGQLLHALLPRVAQIAMNTTFRMFPDSQAAKGEKGAKPQLSAEAMALQQMMQGIHF